MSLSIDPAVMLLRARVIGQVRAFLTARNYVEVDTPVWIAAPAPELHIDCPKCGKAFLRASPELQMKKLLAAGLERIFQIGPCFREGERGKRHNPEFTMLEWYAVQSDYRMLAHEMEALLQTVCGLTHFEYVTVRQAYRQWANWDPWFDWDQDRFDFDMATKIEPNIPKTPTFLIDYPSQAASLSKTRVQADGSVVAERWEVYVNGIELANTFTELTDPVEQRRRFEEARMKREKAGEADYPLDEDFLTALGKMPPTAGGALGLDRLVMVVANCTDIAQIRMLA